MISAMGCLCVWRVEVCNAEIFLGYRNGDQCQSLHDGTLPLPVHTAFNDLQHFQGHGNVKQLSPRANNIFQLILHILECAMYVVCGQAPLKLTRQTAPYWTPGICKHQISSLTLLGKNGGLKF